MQNPFRYKSSFYIIAACLLFLCFYSLLLLTLGTFELNKQFAMSSLFWNMWENLSHFSLAIDPRIIGGEGFAVNGIVTTYFLPFPSLIRGILSLFGFGQSAVLSIAIACFVFFSASLLIWQQIFGSNSVLSQAHGKIYWLSGAFLCTLLSPIIGMLTYPTPFWEVIIWAASLFLMACFLSTLILKTHGNKNWLFLLFTLVCGLALFTRATFSFASCLLFGLTVIQLVVQEWQDKVSFKENLWKCKNLNINILFFAICVGALLTFNYIKWGNPFEFYPLQHYIMMSDEQRTRYFSHGALSLERVPQTLQYYFIPLEDNFSPTRPYIKMGEWAQFGGSSTFDYKEPSLAISITQPIPIMLFISGLIYMLTGALKSHRKSYSFIYPAAIVSLVPVVFILSIHSLSLRYTGDFLPAVMIFGLLGLSKILEAINRITTKINGNGKLNWARAPILGMGFVAIFTSLYLSTAGVFYQNEFWRVPFFPQFNLIPIENGETVQFKYYGNNEKGVGYLYEGWASELEHFGTWSNSNTSTLLILPPKNFNTDGRLSINARAFVTPAHPEQNIDIWVNGKFNQSVKLTNPESNQIIINSLFSVNWFTANPNFIGTSLFNLLTRAIGTPSQAYIYIQFRLKNPARPKELGLGEDNRLLGIGLVSATLE